MRAASIETGERLVEKGRDCATSAAASAIAVAQRLAAALLTESLSLVCGGGVGCILPAPTRLQGENGGSVGSERFSSND